MSVLYGSEAVAIASVLRDNVRQLEILGKIMPYSYIEQPEALDILNGEVEQILLNNMDVETRFKHVLEKYSDSEGLSPKARKDFNKQLDEVSQDMKVTWETINRGLRHNPLSPDNLKKIQEDRLFLQNILEKTADQLEKDGSYEILVQSVDEELNLKEKLKNVVIDEKKSCQRIVQLRNEIKSVKKNQHTEIESRNEMIGHLKDQLQETKAKTQMELKYERSKCDARVAQISKQCSEKERELRDELSELNQQLENEQRVHLETKAWLHRYRDQIQTNTLYWESRLSKDTELMKKNLAHLNTTRTKDLQQLQDLTEKYRQYEDVVIKDRIEKEKQMRKREQEKLEIDASLRIQCWWRTLCARLAIGPYGKKKKGKKGKKGKGGKKGGKKKKK